MQSHSQHTSSSATRRRDHSAAACPATWLVGLTLLFAATASDRVGARRLAGRFLPEYDFEAANERCFYHQRDANESGEGWWFGGAATSSSASDSHHGQPLVSESEGCRPNSAEDTSAEGGSSWLPGTESENTDTLGRGASRSSQRTETRRRSRSRRRRSLSAGRRAQGDVSSDADVDPSSSSSTPSSRASRSTIEAASELPSVPPLAARFGTTVAAAAVMTAVGGNVAVRNVSVRSSPSTPTPSARFVPLPATFASDCQPESAHRGAIPWCCGVCRSPVFQYGTKSCCVDCHAPFDRAAVRVFTGQLRKENTAAYIRWLFALVAPQVQLLHVEAHTTKGEQRTRGAAFVHVPTFEDGAELCQALNRRVFADVQVDDRSGHRVEGVWIVPAEEADRLAEYAASRANAIDRPNVLPRQPVVLEQRGKPSETAQPFRPWVATVPAATFTPMSASALPPARSTPELVGSFAQQPQIAVTYTHNPYAWNPFALLPMQHPRVSAAGVSAGYQTSGWY